VTFCEIFAEGASCAAICTLGVPKRQPNQEKSIAKSKRIAAIKCSTFELHLKTAILRGVRQRSLTKHLRAVGGGARLKRGLHLLLARDLGADEVSAGLERG
jgi:hypothetical protein